MTLDFTPAPAPASLARRVGAHAATEARLILRNGEQYVLALVIPIAVLVAGRWFGDRFDQDFEAIAVSVLGLAIWSTCFTSMAISTGFERRYNVLERLAATPLGRPGILLGKAGALAVVTAMQLVVLATAALVLGWRPGLDPAHLAVAIPAAILGAAAFAGLALCLSGTARPEVTLAVANLLYLGGLAGGIVIPVSVFPSFLQPVIGLLPTGALGEALRSGSVWTLVVLLVWALGSLALARKVFQWTS